MFCSSVSRSVSELGGEALPETLDCGPTSRAARRAVCARDVGAAEGRRQRRRAGSRRRTTEAYGTKPPRSHLGTIHGRGARGRSAAQGKPHAHAEQETPRTSTSRMPTPRMRDSDSGRSSCRRNRAAAERRDVRAAELGERRSRRPRCRGTALRRSRRTETLPLGGKVTFTLPGPVGPSGFLHEPSARRDGAERGSGAPRLNARATTAAAAAVRGGRGALAGRALRHRALEVARSAAAGVAVGAEEARPCRRTDRRRRRRRHRRRCSPPPVGGFAPPPVTPTPGAAWPCPPCRIVRATATAGGRRGRSRCGRGRRFRRRGGGRGRVRRDAAAGALSA